MTFDSFPIWILNMMNKVVKSFYFRFAWELLVENNVKCVLWCRLKMISKMYLCSKWVNSKLSMSLANGIEFKLSYMGNVKRKIILRVQSSECILKLFLNILFKHRVEVPFQSSDGMNRRRIVVTEKSKIFTLTSNPYSRK